MTPPPAPAARLFYFLPALLLAALLAPPVTAQAFRGGPPDISGMAWVEADTFLVVHDGKVPEEADRPRLGRVVLPPHGGPVVWEPLEVAWPEGHGLAHDLESIARVPGTDRYLLAESGDDGEAPHSHLFLATYAGGSVTIDETVEWPVSITNVEGTAVFELGGRRYFVYAERAHGAATTRVSWASFSIDPVAFGPFQYVDLGVPAPLGPAARPVVALDVDTRGRIYVAAAEDLDEDGGPFRSAVYEVGSFESDGEGGARLALRPTPVRWGTLDGVKVEAVAVRDHDGTTEVFIGTDDEDWGAVVRRLPAPYPDK